MDTKLQHIATNNFGVMLKKLLTLYLKMIKNECNPRNHTFYACMILNLLHESFAA